MKIGMIFAGQGSQYVGMGKAFYDAFQEAKDVYDQAHIDIDVKKVCFDGPEDVLNETSYAQPCILTTSLAIAKVIEAHGIHPDYVAGLSLGEYSAACAAGVFSLTDTAKLLRTRGDAMQKAVPLGVGGMAAVIGLSSEKVHELAEACADASNVCVCANDNSDGQIVISGHMGAIDKAVGIAGPEFGAKRCLKLPVSAPFHSPLMKPAAEVMAKALHEVEAHDASIPLISNVLASAISKKEEIIQHLIEQVTGSVRWRESVAYMKNNGVTDVIELGAGKVLSGLVKRCDKEINAISVGSAAEIEELAKSLI